MDSSNGLGKLLPKSISAKRRRRRQKIAEASAADGDAASRELSDDANSTSMADEEDMDDRSFGSFESGADPELTDSARPAASSPPARPATLSAHPPLIVSYLTSSSSAVQARHLDSQSHFQPPPRPRSDRSGSDRGTSPDASTRDHGAPPPSIIEPPAAAKIASPDRRPRAPPRIETRPPRTPPTSDKPAPVIVNTPPTPTDRGHPAAGSSPERKPARSGVAPWASTDGSPPSQNMSAHQRSKSGSAAIRPSKLSNTTLAPLTPTAESGETTPSATGFFSSVISAAQNAATTFSNNIPGTSIGIGGNRSRSSLPKSQGSSTASQVVAEPEPEPEPEPRIEDTMDQKGSAVRTLGSGDLSLSQLGIAEPPNSVASPVSARFADAADTRTRSESAPVDPQAGIADILPAESTSRPRSLVEATSGDQTPPQVELADNKASFPRASSIRSAVKPHRKRGSSVTTGGTGTTGGAAIAASHNSVIAPSGSFRAPKLTGFAIASKKRNRDFHSFFKSVPDDDYLIEDYSCALQREILAHGRLYVSEGHLCFSSNILGWTTTLVMSFDEIVSVEKRSTALVFKNGLMISTLHAKHIFASFTSRDATYDLIVNIWKLGHPTLKSTLNGVRLEGTGGDKTEKVDAEPSGLDNDTREVASDSEDDSEEEEDDDEDFYDEEANEEIPDTQTTELAGVDVDAEKSALRKVSTITVINGVPDAAKESPSPPGGSVDFLGPATHPPTDCGDSATHYDKVVGDDIIPAPLGKVYNLVFGAASVTWMAKWLTGEQKCTDLQMEDKKGLSLDRKTRNFTYIKPLNASIGPRQTKCIVAETLENFDLDKAVNLSVSVQNPDVPNGSMFCVKTKYCLSWAENNATRVQVNCTTEWSGKSWLKGAIEKGVNDGQTQYCRDLFAALKASVTSRPRAGTGPNGPARAKKKLKRSKALLTADGGVERNNGSKHAAKQDWGPLEPVRSIIEPCIDVIQPVLTGNVMYGLLVGLLVAMWFGFGSGPSKNAAPYGPGIGFYSPNRLAAYEEMWRREDSELWEWLDERVGLGRRLSSESSNIRRKSLDPRTIEEKLREERMDEREVDEAIRVTEEKLRVLREVVGKASQSQSQSQSQGREGARRETE
ncbi:Uncharacterized protein TPAR_08604 [Tolypocladium paradoxum]|uniref:VASt domain-containing protein n=1 Tax=Tolypocladium paradoxum TaxID=94208 RepID=A0A2S4KLX7_9HYPO|nr:Uncharacterized protein TPAR_08604 [Tolypocladium paradoxum]